MKWNGFNLDNYRYFSMFCDFDSMDNRLHLPDEVEEVKQILDDYRRTNKNRPSGR
jgi:hypothetical protein